MSAADRDRWDQRWSDAALRPPEAPSAFEDCLDRFPSQGTALDIACGDGAHSWWLAARGLRVTGYDVSAAAIGRARSQTSRDPGVHVPHFEVLDLDAGLPPGPPVDLVLCHRFSDPRLDHALVQRLAPGAVLAVAVLSEVGAQPGRFRAPAGDLVRRFGAFDAVKITDSDEGNGEAWIIAIAATQ